LVVPQQKVFDVAVALFVEQRGMLAGLESKS
jgi:hypothetical protein